MVNTMQFCLAIEKNEIMTFAGKWIVVKKKKKKSWAQEADPFLGGVKGSFLRTPERLHAGARSLFGT